MFFSWLLGIGFDERQIFPDYIWQLLFCCEDHTRRINVCELFVEHRFLLRCVEHQDEKVGGAHQGKHGWAHVCFLQSRDNGRKLDELDFDTMVIKDSNFWFFCGELIGRYCCMCAG